MDVLSYGNLLAIIASNFKYLLTMSIVFIPFERLFPLHPEQKIFRKNIWNDVVYVIVNAAMIGLGGMAAILAGVLTFGQLVPSSLQSAVGAQPIWIQAIEVIILAD